MAVQNDSTLLCKGDLKAYHESIAPYLGGNLMVATNVSDYYSTDEKIVGVWTDKKPIYQKTISCGALPNANTKNVSHNISNIDYIVNIYGVAKRSSDSVYIELSSVTCNTEYLTEVYVKGANIVIVTVQDRSTFTTSYITT